MLVFRPIHFITPQYQYRYQNCLLAMYQWLWLLYSSHFIYSDVFHSTLEQCAVKNKVLLICLNSKYIIDAIIN